MLYGAFLQLEGRRCLVVGGGHVAARKVRSLVDCQADVTVIAPAVTDVISEFAESGTIRWLPRPYEPGDAVAYFLIIAATDRPDVNRRVHDEALRHERLINVVNDQTLGNFIVPAMVRRGRLTIGVSTSGASPAVAKRIRQELEVTFGDEYRVYLDRMAQLRAMIQHTVPDERRRTELFQRLVDSDLLALLRAGKTEEAERLIAATIGGQE